MHIKRILSHLMSHFYHDFFSFLNCASLCGDQRLCHSCLVGITCVAQWHTDNTESALVPMMQLIQLGTDLIELQQGNQKNALSCKWCEIATMSHATAAGYEIRTPMLCQKQWVSCVQRSRIS